MARQHRTYVFLSHSSADKEFVRRLASFIEEELGLDVWLDERAMRPGDQLAQKIGAGLSRAAAVLFVISKSSTRSKWLRFELNNAVPRAIAGKCRLVPVLKEEQVEVPAELRGFLYADFRGGARKGYHGVRSALQPLVDRRETQAGRHDKKRVLSWYPEYVLRHPLEVELRTIYNFAVMNLGNTLAPASRWVKRFTLVPKALFLVEERVGERAAARQELKGLFSAIPMSQRAKSLLDAGRLNAATMTSRHIDPKRPAAVYVSMLLGTDRIARALVLLRLQELLKGQAYATLPLYARPVTQDAARLMRKHGFVSVTDPAPGASTVRLSVFRLDRP